MWYERGSDCYWKKRLSVSNKMNEKRWRNNECNGNMKQHCNRWHINNSSSHSLDDTTCDNTLSDDTPSGNTPYHNTPSDNIPSHNTPSYETPSDGSFFHDLTKWHHNITTWHHHNRLDWKVLVNSPMLRLKLLWNYQVTSNLMMWWYSIGWYSIQSVEYDSFQLSIWWTLKNTITHHSNHDPQ